jgi:hypothetical protein
MLKRTLLSHPKLEVPVAFLAISVVPARTVRSPTTGIGAELLAHREKIEVRPTASPVVRFSGADSRAHRRCTRAVCALPQRMPQTWDSLAEDAVWCELLSVNCQPVDT